MTLSFYPDPVQFFGRRIDRDIVDFLQNNIHHIDATVKIEPGLAIVPQHISRGIASDLQLPGVIAEQIYATIRPKENSEARTAHGSDIVIHDIQETGMIR